MADKKQRMSSREFREMMAQRGEIFPRDTSPVPRKPKNPKQGTIPGVVKRQQIPDLLEYSKAWYEKGGIFIPHDVISKKNSKRPVGYQDANGNIKAHLLLSKQYERYITITYEYYMNGGKSFRMSLKETQLKGPYLIGMYFIRKTAGTLWDHVNMFQGPLDIMQEHKWIHLDNVNWVIPVPLGFEHDPAHPGVVIFLLPPHYYTKILEIPKVGVKW